MVKRLTHISILSITTAVVLSACGLAREPATPGTAVVASPDALPPVVATAAALDDRIVVYRINPDESVVRFELDEDLRGERVTVVGETNQVTGVIAADLDDLSTAVVGPVQINARTLATDNNLRNRALSNRILQTAVYEFITFTPTAVDGLPERVAVGDTVAFDITGELTVRDVTLPVTFSVEATAVDEDQLFGIARAVIRRSDFALSIPSVTGVANVEEEVDLIVEFVAAAS